MRQDRQTPAWHLVLAVSAATTRGTTPTVGIRLRTVKGMMALARGFPIDLGAHLFL